MPTKTGHFDESVLLDRLDLWFLGPILKTLMEGKLLDVQESADNAAAEDAWSRSILHVLALGHRYRRDRCGSLPGPEPRDHVGHHRGADDDGRLGRLAVLSLLAHHQGVAWMEGGHLSGTQLVSRGSISVALSGSNIGHRQPCSGLGRVQL